MVKSTQLTERIKCDSREITWDVQTITKWTFTAALSMAKKWKQPKGASNDEWTRVLAHNGVLFDNKEWSTDICYDTDEPQKH